MNVVDLLVFITVVIFAKRGYRKGLIRESMEAVAAGGGLFIAYRSFVDAGEWLSITVGIPLGITQPVMFAIIAVVIASIGFGLAAFTAASLARQAVWRRADEWCGIAFGALKGCLLCGMCLVLLAQMSLPSVTSALENSAAGRSVFQAMPKFYRQVDHWMERTN